MHQVAVFHTTKEDIDIIMNVIKNKMTLIIHFIQSIKNTLQLLKMKKYFQEIVLGINSISLPEISQSLINRILYILEKVENLLKKNICHLGCRNYKMIQKCSKQICMYECPLKTVRVSTSLNTSLGLLGDPLRTS